MLVPHCQVKTPLNRKNTPIHAETITKGELGKPYKRESTSGRSSECPSVTGSFSLEMASLRAHGTDLLPNATCNLLLPPLQN